MSTETVEPVRSLRDDASLQDIYDFVANHLLTQGSPALDKNGDCVYRTQDGRSCAVGCLIPDANYHDDMEFRGVAVLAEQFRKFLPDFISANVPFLINLQSLHDNTPPQMWREGLADLAAKYDLRPFRESAEDTAQAPQGIQ